MRHPSFLKFDIDYSLLGPSVTLAKSASGQQIIESMLSRDAVNAVIGAITVAPSRPPQPALDRYLLPVIGMRAADDDVKILVGRVLRQMIEYLGGTRIRPGVAVTVASVFANGSIYSLPTTRHGRMDAAARRVWAEQRIAELAKAEAA